MYAVASGNQPSSNRLWTPCYVALGSNLQQPVSQLQRACVELAQLPASRLIACSSLYESKPMGPQDQPDFVNAVAALLTHLSAPELLAQLQGIEQRMGRQPMELRWGPRLIDLDLLLHGVTHSETTELQLPHPGMLQRSFVMAPLAEIAPQLMVAKTQSAIEVARALGMQGLRRVDEVTHS